MSTEQVYHYVYRITNTKINKHYYGKRSSKRLPIDDIGKYYFSSSTDKAFIKDQKNNPQDYKYKIVLVCKSSIKAVEFEIKLHNKFNVGVNTNFYNKVKQTSEYYDTTGISYKGVNLGFVVVKDALGATKRVSKDDAEYVSGKLVHHLKGKKLDSVARQNISNGHKGHKNFRAVPVDIYNYYTNELVASNVVLTEWCKGTIYHEQHLRKTIVADRNKPHCSNSSYKERINVHHHKGLYAVKIT